MSGMAEVLAGHTGWATTNPDGEWLVTCVDCKATLGTYDAIVERGDDRSSYDQMDAALAAHQAAALSAAGFGDVADVVPGFNSKLQELAKRLLDEDIADSLEILDNIADGKLRLI